MNVRVYHPVRIALAMAKDSMAKDSAVKDSATPVH
jgi:hypothetical protein